MAAERVTAFPAMPAIFGILASLKKPEQYNWSEVRIVASAGVGLAAGAIRLLGRWFPRARVYSTYGMTECGRCAYLPPEDVARKAGSVGIAMPGMALGIIDGEGPRHGGRTRALEVLEPGAAVTEKDVLRACVEKLENHRAEVRRGHIRVA